MSAVKFYGKELGGDKDEFWEFLKKEQGIADVEIFAEDILHIKIKWNGIPCFIDVLGEKNVDSILLSSKKIEDAEAVFNLLRKEYGNEEIDYQTKVVFFANNHISFFFNTKEWLVRFSTSDLKAFLRAMISNKI